LATKISFINEIANVCEEVRRRRRPRSPAGWGSDERIGRSFLRAGIGYGGLLLPQGRQRPEDAAGNTGYHFQLLTSVIEVNELQKRRVRQAPGTSARWRASGWRCSGSLQADTDDMREASSLVLAARRLRARERRCRLRPVALGGAGCSTRRVSLLGWR
jgi:UDPglucose 6-dehydrogenase